VNCLAKGLGDWVNGSQGLLPSLFLTRFAAHTSQGDPAKPCLEMMDAVSKQLLPEIHHKMLPASRAIALRWTSKTMRTAGVKADAVVQARGGIEFPDGRGLLEKLIGLHAWCKATALRLESCGLREGGGRALAEALRLNTTLASLDLGGNGLVEGAGRALAEALRLNTTVTSLNLHRNRLVEGAGRALAEALGALAEALRINTTVTSLTLSVNQLPGRGRRAGAGRGPAPQHHGYVAQPPREWPGRGRRAGAGTGPAPRHHTCVAQPSQESHRGGRRAGAGTGPAPQHHPCVAQPKRQLPGRGAGRALSEALRLNSTLASLNLIFNFLGEGGGRALAEALRLNTTVTSLDLSFNHLGEGGGRALAEIDQLTLDTRVDMIVLDLLQWYDNPGGERKTSIGQKGPEVP